jgi:hypothetical protein
MAMTMATSLAAAPTGGQRSYVAALHAFDSGDYAEAVGLFRASVAEDPKEALAKFAVSSGSLNRVDYFPHLFLGLSLEKSGHAKEAIEELEESKRQGAVLAKSGLTRILQAALHRLQPASAPSNPVDTAAASPTAVPNPMSPLTRTPLSVASSRTPAPNPTAALASLPSTVPTRAEQRQATGKPPRNLRGGVAEGGRAGIRSFFDGDFGAAEKKLTPLVDSLPVARLFLAYTLASEALLAGQANGPLALNARAEYRRAQEQGVPRSTDALVSPSVRRLLTAE